MTGLCSDRVLIQSQDDIIGGIPIIKAVAAAVITLGWEESQGKYHYAIHRSWRMGTLILLPDHANPKTGKPYDRPIEFTVVSYPAWKQHIRRRCQRVGNTRCQQLPSNSSSKPRPLVADLTSADPIVNDQTLASFKALTKAG